MKIILIIACLLLGCGREDEATTPAASSELTLVDDRFCDTNVMDLSYQKWSDGRELITARFRVDGEMVAYEFEYAAERPFPGHFQMVLSGTSYFMVLGRESNKLYLNEESVDCVTRLR